MSSPNGRLTKSCPETSKAESSRGRGRGNAHRHRPGEGARGIYRGAPHYKNRLDEPFEDVKHRGKPTDVAERKGSTSERPPHGSRREDYIFFWKTEDDYGWASQWHAEPFDGPARLYMESGQEDDEFRTRRFNTAESWMMYHKALLFGDRETAEEILKATNPKDIKALGQKVSNFNEDIWQQKRYDIVFEGNKYRFQSNLELKKKLLETGDKILVEASKFDSIWGVGFTQKDAFENRDKWGLNLLGQALMDVRQLLRESDRQ